MDEAYLVRDLDPEEVESYLDAVWSELARDGDAERKVPDYDPALLPDDWRDAIEVRLGGEGLSPEMVVLILIFKKGFAAAAGAKAAQMVYDIWKLAIERIRKDRGRDSIVPRRSKPESDR